MKFWLVCVALLLMGIRNGWAETSSLGSVTSSDVVPPSVHPLQGAGIENFYQLSERVYSGSVPEGDAAFADLKARGIKTIITVDGAKPDAETARRFGIRYVHLPIGYDGVPANQGLRLVKAAETLPGPIFVHCHHGIHRGPTGAAIICMAEEGWTPEQAESWLRLAGTATNYAGLYRSVEQFHPPTAEVLSGIPVDFPEQSPVSALADVMIQIDGRFDHLKTIKKAGYQKSSAHPDLDPADEALLLDELFKELQRSPLMEERTDDFRAKLSEAEGASAALHRSLSAPPVEVRQADSAFQRLTDGCAACHKRYRN